MAYRGVEEYLHAFLIPELGWRYLSVSGPGRFTSGERDPGVQQIGGWVVSGAGLHVSE
jgi:hypothetical protein